MNKSDDIYNNLSSELKNDKTKEELQAVFDYINNIGKVLLMENVGSNTVTYKD